MKKLIKIFVIILIPIFIVGVVYGAARIDNAVKGKKTVLGTVAEKLWDEDMEFDSDSYYTMTADDEFKVLMVTDIHFMNGGWYAKYLWFADIVNKGAMKSIEKMVKEFSPDLIIVAGDLLTDSLSDVIFQDFCDFMAKFETPWTFTFGNHDPEYRADKSALAEILMAADYCLFDAGFTNLIGLGNNVIAIKNTQGKLLYAFVLMDFGDWQQRKHPGRLYSTEDVGPNENQEKWYEWVIRGLAEENGGEMVETMLVCHIPMHAYTYAVELGEFSSYNGAPFDAESEFGYETAEFAAYRKQYRETGTKGNQITAAAYEEYKANDTFFAKIYALGSTKHMASGHNHCDGYTVSYDSITYTSIVKTGDNYTSKDWDNGNRGGSFFKFQFGSTVKIEVSPYYC